MDKEAYDKLTGLHLRELRSTRGFTQKSLGEAIGVSHQQMQKYENGKNELSLWRLHQVCKVLQMQPHMFLLMLAHKTDKNADLVVLDNPVMRMAHKVSKLKPRDQRIVFSVVDTMSSPTISINTQEEETVICE